MEQDNLLKEIQKAELYLLVEFDRVCREHGFTYFLDSGTALGAVRHGGFIPWDDDIDVGMPRKDYDRFMEIGQSLLPKNIFLQNRQTEKNYIRYAAKLRLEGTVFQETDELPYEHNGFFIDIFPFDNVPSKENKARRNIKFMVGLIHILKSYTREGDCMSHSILKRQMFRLLRRLPQKWFNAFEKASLRFARKRQDKETGKMSCYFWKMSLNKQYIFETDRMLPVKDVSFEGHDVKIMRDPDYYLTKMYGDYMQLPPVEQREYHRASDGIINFGQ